MKNGILVLILLASVLLLLASVQAQEDTGLVRPEKPSSVNGSSILLPKKSPFGALVRSVVFPGGGQFYNKKTLKGSIVFAAESGFLVAAIVEWKRRDQHQRNFERLPPSSPNKAWEFELYGYYRDMRNTHLWCVAGIVFFSMLDAYVDAHLYNFEKDRVREVNVSLAPQVEKEKVGVFFSINF